MRSIIFELSKHIWTPLMESQHFVIIATSSAIPSVLTDTTVCRFYQLNKQVLLPVTSFYITWIRLLQISIITENLLVQER